MLKYDGSPDKVDISSKKDGVLFCSDGHYFVKT